MTLPRRAAVLALTLAGAAPASAQGRADVFLDDRSSPERVVESLYDAIGRHEYLRAWSYFREDPSRPYPAFRAGYEATGSVEIRLGETAAEGAAGSIHSTVPLALRATGTDGSVAIYVGCYRLTQVQPAAQEVPPFRPIQIDDGSLRPTTEPFETAMGPCG